MNDEVFINFSKQSQPDRIKQGGITYKKVESKAKKCPKCGRRKGICLVCPNCGHEYEEPQYENCAWCGKEYRKLRKTQKYCSKECHHERDKDAQRKNPKKAK